MALKEEIKSRLLEARQQYVTHIKAEVEWRAHFEDKVSSWMLALMCLIETVILFQG